MKILFIAEVASIHVARWVNQFEHSGWDVRLFQAVLSTYGGVCPELKYSQLYLPHSADVPKNLAVLYTLPRNDLFNEILFKMKKKEKIISILKYWIKNYLHRAKKTFPIMLHYNSEEQIADNAKAFISHSAYLARVIKEWVPDVIHILGINVNWRSNGEVLLKVLERNRDQKPCPIIVSTWGADLDLYPSKGETEHKEVEAILKITDGLLVEGERDESLARKLGFRGQILAKLPAFGGVTWEAKDFSSTVVPSQRKVIILKGRDNKDALGKGGDPQGRAMTAIRAFSLCEDVIKPYSIIVTQASPAIVEAVNQLKKDTKIKISISNMLTYKKWLDLLNKARIVLAVTVSDGLPSTLVEAMSLGTFPIHSGLETVREWIQDGENGFLVEPEDIQGVALALRRTLLDDELVDRAAEINANLVESYLSEKVILPKIMRLYEQIPLWYKLGSPPFERIS